MAMSTGYKITVYHNPACSKSRRVCELLTEQGVELQTHLYLEQPLPKAQLQDLMVSLGIQDPRLMMRTKEALYSELGLAEAGHEALLQAMVEHPRLMERPIVVMGERALIARPPELALELVAG